MNWDVQWPLPAAFVTRRPPAPPIVTVWRGGPLNNESGSSARQTIAPLMQAALGRAVGRGMATQSLAPLIQSAQARSVARGSAAHVVAPMVQAATGRSVAMATAAQQSAAMTQSASGSAVGIGQAAQVSGGVSQTATARAVSKGVSTQAIAAVMQAASGSAVAKAQAGQVVAALAQSAAGHAVGKGSASQTVAALVQTASGGAAADPTRGGWNTTAGDAGIMTFTNDDRTVTSPGATWPGIISKASFSSGNIYLSVRFDAYEYGGIGINDFDKSHEIYFGWDGQIYTSSGGTIDTITGFAAPCDIDVAVRTDDHLVWFRVNGGNWNDDPTADPTAAVGGYPLPGTGLTYYVQVGLPYFAGSQRTLNTGTAAFAHPAPAGFSPLLP